MERIRRVITDEVREPPPGFWSNCRAVGNQLFIAGLVAMDDSGIAFKSMRRVDPTIEDVFFQLTGSSDD